MKKQRKHYTPEENVAILRRLCWSRCRSRSCVTNRDSSPRSSTPGRRSSSRTARLPFSRKRGPTIPQSSVPKFSFYRMSLALQAVAPGHYFEFGPDCVLDGNYGSCVHFKCREHRAKLVNHQRIVAVHQQMPAPLAHTHYEELDLKIGWRLPLAKHIKDSLLSILVLRRRTLRAFEPADHVFHLISFIAIGLTDQNRLGLLLGDRCWTTSASLRNLWTGGPLKPSFGLSGAVLRLDKAFPPLVLAFSQPTRIQSLPGARASPGCDGCSEAFPRIAHDSGC